MNFELLCTYCGDKQGWHHAKPTKKDPRICYGIGCDCPKFMPTKNGEGE